MLQDDIRIPPPGYRSAPQRRAAETRRTMLVAGGVGAVLVLGLLGYFVAAGSGSQTIPIIQPSPGPVMVKPVNPGGLQVNTQTTALLGGAGSGADATLAPAPETPDPAALAAAAQREQANPSNPPVAPPPPPSPSVSIPTVPETPAPIAQGAAQRTALNVPPPSPTTAAVHNLAQEYKPPAPQFADHGHVRVQLAALDSREAALREWTHLTHRMPGLFDGRKPIFVEAHVDGHTFWRVRTTGFTSVTEASQFCDAVHAKGAACTVAAF